MMANDDLIEAMRALAHPLRWRILAALSGGERNVGEIEAATGISQPGLSQQLGVLRKAGLVRTRKEAKMVFYTIAMEALSEVTSAMAALAPSGSQPAPAQGEPAGQRTPAPGVANFARIS
jgi:DNA-binding transcriptional ArsR family regulator